MTAAQVPVRSIRAGRGVPKPTGEETDTEVPVMPQVLPRRQTLYRIVGKPDGRRRVWYPRHAATARNRVRLLRRRGQLVSVDVAEVEWRRIDPEELG